MSNDIVRRISELSPIHAWELLSDLRVKAAFTEVQRRLDNRLQPALSLDDPLLNPVNPVLMSSAIGLSIIRNQDYNSFLVRYTSGSELSTLDKELMMLPRFDNEGEACKFFEIEERYVDGLCLLSIMRLIAKSQRYPNEFVNSRTRIIRGIEPYFYGFDLNITPDKVISEIDKLVSKFWSDVQSTNLTNKNNNPIEFDVMQFAWLNANPICQFLVGRSLESALLNIQLYGIKSNNSIHNAREYYENNLNDISARINDILSQKISKEEKKTRISGIKLLQVNASKAMNRAMRLYYWNPGEIRAYITSGLVALKIRQHDAMKQQKLDNS